MKNLQSSLVSLAAAALTAWPLVSAAQSQPAQTPQVAQAAQTANKAILDTAVDHFYAGWAYGNWEPFLATLSDDFIFQFPAGPHAGRHVGAVAKQKMIAFVTEHAKAGNRVTNVQMTLRINNGEWIVTNDRGRGVIDGKPYDQLHAIFMRAKDGKIVEFREYFGNLAGF
jgi:ketosteroid isomerase-like protein